MAILFLGFVGSGDLATLQPVATPSSSSAEVDIFQHHQVQQSEL